MTILNHIENYEEIDALWSPWPLRTHSSRWPPWQWPPQNDLTTEYFLINWPCWVNGCMTDVLLTSPASGVLFIDRSHHKIPLPLMTIVKLIIIFGCKLNLPFDCIKLYSASSCVQFGYFRIKSIVVLLFHYRSNPVLSFDDSYWSWRHQPGDCRTAMTCAAAARPCATRSCSNIQLTNCHIL